MKLRASWTWAAVAAYAGLIIAASSIPGKSISVPAWSWDKALHAVEYFVLGALLARALAFKLRLGAALFTAALLCAAFGALDELYQSTTPGRMSSPYDTIADFVGGTLGAVSVTLWRHRKEPDGDRP
jgi:VanZ family protein